MDLRVLQAFHVEMSKLSTAATSQPLLKRALLERLIRLGATDIPGTPRLLMKKRTPSELAALQRGVALGWDKHVTSPLMRVAEHGLKRLPDGKARRIATAGARMIAEDPVGAVATRLIPVPGAAPAWIAAKRGLEHAIDRVAPV